MSSGEPATPVPGEIPAQGAAAALGLRRFRNLMLVAYTISGFATVLFIGLWLLPPLLAGDGQAALDEQLSPGGLSVVALIGTALIHIVVGRRIVAGRAGLGWVAPTWLAVACLMSATSIIWFGAMAVLLLVVRLFPPG